MCNERAMSSSSSSSSDGAVTCSPGQQISWKAAFSLSGLETSTSSDSNHARIGKTGNDPNAKARQCVVFFIFFFSFFLSNGSACSSQQWPRHLRQPRKVEVLNVILPARSQCKLPPLPHPSHKLMAGRVSIGRTCARQNLRTHKTSLWFAAAASNHRPIRGIFAVGGCFKRLNPSSQRGACAGHCRHPGDTL